MLIVTYSKEEQSSLRLMKFAKVPLVLQKPTASPITALLGSVGTQPSLVLTKTSAKKVKDKPPVKCGSREVRKKERREISEHEKKLGRRVKKEMSKKKKRHEIKRQKK